MPRSRAHARARARTAALAPLGLALACADNLTPAAPDGGSTDDTFACLPDLDGRLAAAELPIALDAAAQYLVATDEIVSLAGPPWDWRAELAGEDKRSFAAAPLATQWYAAAFPAGEFATAAGPGVDAVYSADDDALWLHGLASIEPDRTLLAYDAPVAVLRLPLAVGDAWTETGTVTGGTLDNLPYSGTDTYEVAVDARGELALPHLRFTDAYRVRTRVTVAPAVGGASVTRRQASFLFECFGEVARATSRDDEPLEDFTVAAEVRRFSL
jgi:hypothetical protein